MAASTSRIGRAVVLGQKVRELRSDKIAVVETEKTRLVERRSAGEFHLGQGAPVAFIKRAPLALGLVIIIVPCVGGIGAPLDDLLPVVGVRLVAADLLPTERLVAGLAVNALVARDDRVAVQREADDVVMLLRAVRRLEHAGRCKVKMIVRLPAGVAVAVVEDAVDVRVAIRMRNLRLVRPVDRQPCRRDRHRAEQRNLRQFIRWFGETRNLPIEVLPAQPIRRRGDKLERRDAVAFDDDRVVVERHRQLRIGIAVGLVFRVR